MVLLVRSEDISNVFDMSSWRDTWSAVQVAVLSNVEFDGYFVLKIQC